MQKEITIIQALSLVLDYVERWNKQDKEHNVAEAASILDNQFGVTTYQAQVESAKRTNEKYTSEQRTAAAKKAWETKKAAN